MTLSQAIGIMNLAHLGRKVEKIAGLIDQKDLEGAATQIIFAQMNLTDFVDGKPEENPKENFEVSTRSDSQNLELT